MQLNENIPSLVEYCNDQVDGSTINPRDLGISRREKKEKKRKNLLRPMDGQKKSTRRLITHLAAFIWVSTNAAGDFRVRLECFSSSRSPVYGNVVSFRAK